jgi:L-rhamnose mutarotase
MKLSTAAIVVSLASLASPSHAFAPLAMNKQNKRHQQGRMAVPAPLFLWVDQFSTPLVPPSSSPLLEARIKDCLMKGSNVEDTTMLLKELEDLLHACTEECNQTKDECDVFMKDQRDVWIKALEDQISSAAVSTMVMSLSSATKSKFSTPLVPPSSSPLLEARIKDCLMEGCNVEDTTMLLKELEDLLYACTEECNQTNDECDVFMKDQRDVWIKSLEDQISSTAVSARPISLSSATKSSATSLEEQVKACWNDDNASKLTLQDLKTLLVKLEAKHYECTEEGNQTLDECDLTVKADREHWIKQLERAIQNPSLQQIQASLEQGNCDLSELPHLLAVLEHQSNLCTEEGHQTSDVCDLAQREQRTELMQVLEDQILKTQTQTAKQTHHCMTYQLCNTQALSKTLHNLEEVSNLCTEDGNQTRSFCNLEAKQEREDVMERICHQLELAETALMKEVVFQI